MAEILVCDDDKAIVEAIEIYLSQEGHHILKAYDGEEALRTLRENPVDLLIIDVMMPKLDGIRATLKIREENPLPIIILSASQRTRINPGPERRADDYVTKPLTHWSWWPESDPSFADILSLALYLRKRKMFT